MGSSDDETKIVSRVSDLIIDFKKKMFELSIELMKKAEESKREIKMGLHPTVSIGDRFIITSYPDVPEYIGITGELVEAEGDTSGAYTVEFIPENPAHSFTHMYGVQISPIEKARTDYSLPWKGTNFLVTDPYYTFTTDSTPQRAYVGSIGTIISTPQKSKYYQGYSFLGLEIQNKQVHLHVPVLPAPTICSKKAPFPSSNLRESIFRPEGMAYTNNVKYDESKISRPTDKIPIGSEVRCSNGKIGTVEEKRWSSFGVKFYDEKILLYFPVRFVEKI